MKNLRYLLLIIILLPVTAFADTIHLKQSDINRVVNHPEELDSRTQLVYNGAYFLANGSDYTLDEDIDIYKGMFIANTGSLTINLNGYNIKQNLVPEGFDHYGYLNDKDDELPEDASEAMQVLKTIEDFRMKMFYMMDITSSVFTNIEPLSRTPMANVANITINGPGKIYSKTNTSYMSTVLLFGGAFTLNNVQLQGSILSTTAFGNNSVLSAEANVPLGFDGNIVVNLNNSVVTGCVFAEDVTADNNTSINISDSQIGMLVGVAGTKTNITNSNLGWGLLSADGNVIVNQGSISGVLGVLSNTQLTINDVQANILGSFDGVNSTVTFNRSNINGTLTSYDGNLTLNDSTVESVYPTIATVNSNLTINNSTVRSQSVGITSFDLVYLTLPSIFYPLKNKINIVNSTVEGDFVAANLMGEIRGNIKNSELYAKNGIPLLLLQEQELEMSNVYLHNETTGGVHPVILTADLSITKDTFNKYVNYFSSLRPSNGAKGDPDNISPNGTGLGLSNVLFNFIPYVQQPEIHDKYNGYLKEGYLYYKDPRYIDNYVLPDSLLAAGIDTTKNSLNYAQEQFIEILQYMENFDKLDSVFAKKMSKSENMEKIQELISLVDSPQKVANIVTDPVKILDLLNQTAPLIDLLNEPGALSDLTPYVFPETQAIIQMIHQLIDTYIPEEFDIFDFVRTTAIEGPELWIVNASQLYNVDDAVYAKPEDDEVVVTVDGNSQLLEKIEVNGQTLSPNDYRVFETEENQFEIRIRNNCLQDLDYGSYPIRVTFVNGDAESKLRVVKVKGEVENPETGLFNYLVLIIPFVMVIGMFIKVSKNTVYRKV